MTVSRLAIQRDVQAGTLARVFVNQTEVGVVARGDWDAAMRLICDFAVDEFGDELREQCNNVVQLRALSLNRLGVREGAEPGKGFPLLTKRNSHEQALPDGTIAMMVIVGGDEVPA